MRSVDKLRELADKLDESAARMSEHGFSPIGMRAAILCDEIEAEIADRYMELPVDADGVPIRVGDILERVDGGPSQQACCICPQGFNDAPIWCARDFRHVKPRTLEDVLREFAGDYRRAMNAFEEGDEYGPSITELTARCATEIRELMGGDICVHFEPKEGSE